MKIFKRIAAGLVAVATIASLSVSAFADEWSINYTYGAPSSVSTQFVKKTYIGFSGKFVSVDVYSVNKGGLVEVIGKDFSPYGSLFFEHRSYTQNCKFFHPGNEPTVEIWARANRVIANGQVLWV